MALARITAVRGATSGPENSTTSGIASCFGCTTSDATNSSATSAGSFFLSPPSFEPLLRPGTSASTRPTMTTAPIAPPTQSPRREVRDDPPPTGCCPCEAAP